MLQEAMEALFDDGEVTEFIAHIGVNILATYFNYIADTEIVVLPVDLEHFRIDHAHAINLRSNATQAYARWRGGLRPSPQSGRIRIK